MKLVAMFGWKYEPKWMVDQLIENLSGWVDDFAILDDRKRKDELWRHEGDYRRLLREKAFKMKADWVLITSPDERWEKYAGDRIRPFIDNNKDKVIYQFHLLEMFGPKLFRSDGIWGKKVRNRLYPLLPNQRMCDRPIQCPNVPQNPEYVIKPIDVNIHHLKMIEPENRKMRTRVFMKLDPYKVYQNIGYEYLDDEKDMVLTPISDDRGYLPKYKKYLFKVPEKLL